MKKKDKYKIIRIVLLSIILILMLVLLFVDRTTTNKNNSLNSQNQTSDTTTGYEQINPDRFKVEKSKKKTFYLMICSMPNDECIDMNNIAKELSDNHQIFFIDAGHYMAKINAAEPGSYESEKAIADYRSMLDVIGATSIPSVLYYQDGELTSSYIGYFTDEYYSAFENNEDTTEIIKGINDNIRSFIKQNKNTGLANS